MAADIDNASRVAVLGAGGQLGRALCRALGAGRAAAWGRAALDLERPETFAARLGDLRAAGGETVINAAAMTAVDRCETEPERAWRINAEAPGAIAELCARLGLHLVHVSTDYVFAGTGDRPWREDDQTAPLSVYGKTKLAGEERVRAALPDALVVRTAWVFGDGGNFIRTILCAAARAQGGEGPPLRVVDDQRGSPTYAQHLAEGILALLEAGESGTYHLANSGVASWWELARAATDAAGLELPIEAVTSDVFPRPAPRPAWSVLDLSRARRAGVLLPSWREGLQAYLESPESPLRGESG